MARGERLPAAREAGQIGILGSRSGGDGDRYAPLSFERALSLEHVSYRYPATTRSAIDDISITIPKGHWIGLIGPTGAGKTTLVEAFLDELDQADILLPIWVGRGQCIEQHGAGEAYMPVLEALERLCRRPDGERLLRVLDQHAPTWLAQLPSLLAPTELEALRRRIQGVTRERMA